VIQKATGIDPAELVRELIDGLTLPNFNKQLFDSFNTSWMRTENYPFETMLAILTAIAGLDFGQYTHAVIYPTKTGFDRREVDKPGIFLPIDSLIKILNAINDVKIITRE
jgi:hypothetical protein